MKILLLLSFGFLSINLTSLAQNSHLIEWISEIEQSILAMESLSAYSSKEVEDDVKVDMILADRVKVEEVTDSTFSILVDHGKGVFCTKLLFQYTEINTNDYRLVFSDLRERDMMGTTVKVIDPWIEKNSDGC